MQQQAIKQILLEQKQEIKQIFQEKIAPRQIQPAAKKAMEDKLIKVISGIRRCGKSVLAHQLLKDSAYGYINFDDERLFGIKAQDLNYFLEILKEINPDFKILLLDEVHNVLGWELFVNRLKRLGYNIIVTGSNSQLLCQELSSRLTGRHINLELFPFSFREFLAYKNFQYSKEDLHIAEQKGKLKRLFNEYLKQGGFPELFKIKLKKQYLRDLYEKILVRDIILRFNIKYVRDLKEIALYLISNFAAKISYNKIKNIFDIGSVHTVKNYIDYIEQSYLIFQISPFSFKLKRQLMQAKKIYVIDTGLVKAISFKVSSNQGRLMENLVFIELLRQGREIYFYSDQSQKEVDFILREGLKIKQLIQVCQDLTDEMTRKRELISLIHGSQELKCNDLLIITDDFEGEEIVKRKKIKFLPLWKWLLE